MRLAILGLYNSGSSAIAGMLHRLGVNMGAPYWENSDDNSPQNHYEPFKLAERLRDWWDEPNLTERVRAARRVRYLKRWIAEQECWGLSTGAKHPLLSLCGRDLLAAWGEDARLIWSYRPLTESISGLQRRGWFSGRETQMQQRLWDSLCELSRAVPGVIKIDYDGVKTDPWRTVKELVILAGLEPSAEQVEAAVRFVKVPALQSVATESRSAFTLRLNRRLLWIQSR